MLSTTTLDPSTSTDASYAGETTSRPMNGSSAGTGLSRQSWIVAILLIVVTTALYYRVAFKLVRDWYTYPDNSHGLLIPFFVLFLLWDKRKVLMETPLRPSWAGIVLILPALLMLMVGVFGADLFLSRLSFVLLVAGIVWMLLGTKMLGEVKFLLFVCLLAIPLPTVVLNQITFPLQLMASRLASSLLPLAGVPVLREGNVIQLPSIQLEVAEACSGIRSLMSLFAVAVIYGYFIERGVGKRTILALASLPIAVAANSARIFGTGLCVQYWDPDKALGFFHEFSGWLIFVVSLGFLYLVHRAMHLFSGKSVVSA